MVIEFPHTTVYYVAPVVYLIFKEDAELDVPEVRELVAAAEKLSKGKPYLLLSDTRKDNLIITPQARVVGAEKKEAKFLVANAVIVNSLPVQLTMNFFVNFNKPTFPLKIFNTEKKALEWIYTFADDKKLIVPKSIPKPQ